MSSNANTFGAGMGCGALFAVMIVPLLSAFTLPSALIRGYVLWVLWGWFLMPLGAPEIGYGQAVGVALIAGFLFHRATAENPTKSDTMGEIKKLAGVMLANLVFGPAITMLIGWGVHHWLM